MFLRKKTFQAGLAAIIFLLGIFYFTGAALAGQTNEITVEVWDGAEWKPLCQADCDRSLALFSNTNFLPGDAATRRVKVTNKDVSGAGSGTAKEIVIEAINASNPYLGLPFIADRFGDILNFKVKEDGGGVSYEKTLSEFFNETGGVEITSTAIPNSGEREFEFSVYFNETGDDRYQDKSVGFDVIFGLKGEEGGSGGGGSSPSALSISNENSHAVAEAIVAENSAIISWTTSYKATSQVIYCRKDENCLFNLSDNAASPPLYGYLHTTGEGDTPANLHGVTSHAMILKGLDPGTTYEYRTVSHASPPTISRVYSFTTQGYLAGNKTKENQVAFMRRPDNISGENVIAGPDAETKPELKNNSAANVELKPADKPELEKIEGKRSDEAGFAIVKDVLGTENSPKEAEKNVQNTDNNVLSEIAPILSKIIAGIIILAALAGLAYYGARIKKGKE